MVKDIEIKEFDYPLPDDRIAGHPLEQRDECKLLISDSEGRISHDIFKNLPELISEGALLVCNDTKVINARMSFVKETGSRIEVFLLEPVSPADYANMFQTTGSCRWKCMIGNLKRWKQGALSVRVPLDGGKEVVLSATRVEAAEGNSHIVEFDWQDPDVTFASLVEAAGKIPIPPYLKRDTEETDSRDYQTVYSKIMGSVAAPTAGLHFTDSVLNNLKERGVEMQRVTLHVGAGTFQPVKSDTIGEHPMHTETFIVDRDLVKKLINALKTGREIVAVGTTTVRTLESLPCLGMKLMRGIEDNHVEQWMAYADEYSGIDTLEALQALEKYMEMKEISHLTAHTAIMIAPGFRWRIVNRMITNFHQPQSTLLLLVSSFLDGGNEKSPQWKHVYDVALENGYRFLSYGDACLFERMCKKDASDNILK